MSTEQVDQYEVDGRKLLGTLAEMSYEGRVRFMAHTIALERECAAALDYAEARLSEMRAQLETLADEVDRDGLPWDAEGARAWAVQLREVARG
jgi:hypothetical protein